MLKLQIHNILIFDKKSSCTWLSHIEESAFPLQGMSISFIVYVIGFAIICPSANWALLLLYSSSCNFINILLIVSLAPSIILSFFTTNYTLYNLPPN